MNKEREERKRCGQGSKCEEARRKETKEVTEGEMRGTQPYLTYAENEKKKKIRPKQEYA